MSGASQNEKVQEPSETKQKVMLQIPPEGIRRKDLEIICQSEGIHFVQISVALSSLCKDRLVRKEKLKRATIYYLTEEGKKFMAAKFEYQAKLEEIGIGRKEGLL